MGGERLAVGDEAQRLLRGRTPWAAAIVRDGRVETLGRGAARDARFEIGSVSKGVTGCLYADAVERGEVEPGTRLGDLLPVTGDVARVNLESLSRHRSGLPRLPAAAHPWRRTRQWLVHGTNPYGDSLADLIQQVEAQKVGRPRPAYSNLGYQLLGHAVAAAAGTSYAALVRDRHVEPLALGRMGVVERPDQLDADDLRGTDRLGRPQEPWTGEALGPAGGIRADAEAMGRFLAALLDRSAPGVAATEPSAGFGRRLRIGAAWFTLDVRGRSVTWTNGATGGFTTWVGFDRRAGAGVAVMSARRVPVDGAGFRLLAACG